MKRRIFRRRAARSGAEAENAPDVDDAEDEVLIEIARALDALPEDEGMSERERDAVRARLEFRRSHHEMMKVLARAFGKATGRRRASSRDVRGRGQGAIGGDEEIL